MRKVIRALLVLSAFLLAGLLIYGGWLAWIVWDQCLNAPSC